MATPEALPKGTLVRVSFNFTLPIEVAEADLREWLEFELGGRCDMSGENPLRDYDVEGLGLELTSSKILETHP